MPRGDAVFLEADLPPSFDGLQVEAVTGAALPRVRFFDADFEERDGSPVTIDQDLLGARKDVFATYPAGPIAALSAVTSRLRVW